MTEDTFKTLPDYVREWYKNGGYGLPRVRKHLNIVTVSKSRIVIYLQDREAYHTWRKDKNGSWGLYFGATPDFLYTFLRDLPDEQADALWKWLDGNNRAIDDMISEIAETHLDVKLANERGSELQGA